MKWIFSEQSNSEIRRDPSEAELFKNSQDDTEEYAGVDTLVRETIQNSLDAASEQVVRVCISLHGKNDMPSPERLADYFRRLESPLKTKDIVYHPDGAPDLDCGFLVCEDFGTRGLEGDPHLSRNPPEGSTERQDFFWFWRNIARSGKTGDDLGRWGLGKVVYRAASRIGCMLGMTVRESDRKKLVMGQAVLKIHEYEGKEWKSDGFWCQGADKTELPLPIDLPEDVERFQKEWKLTRTDEPGLSIVVPYVVALKGNSLLQAVAINFFDLILRGKLIAEIKAPDVGHVKLTESTIQKECDRITWNGTKSQKRHAPPPMNLAKECLKIRGKAVPSFLLGEKKIPELSSESFDAKALEGMRRDFQDEKLVAARIRMMLHRKDAEGSGEDSFLVFLKKESDQKSPDSYYIREGMTITKINSTKAKSNNARGMVYVEKGLLASLLGDTEGPAHEDWLTSSERAERIWKLGWKGRVTFVRRIVDAFYDVLSPPIEKADYDFLSDFFSLDNKDFPTPSRMPGENDGDAKPSFPALESPPQWFQIQEKKGGIKISHNATQEIPKNARLTIQFAYDVVKGNPLKKWSPFDFNLKVDLKKGGRMVPIPRKPYSDFIDFSR